MFDKEQDTTKLKVAGTMGVCESRCKFKEINALCPRE